MDHVIQQGFKIRDQSQTLAGAFLRGEGTAFRAHLSAALLRLPWGRDKDVAYIP